MSTGPPLPPFTKLLLYSYNPTLRLDLTGSAEIQCLTADCDMEDAPAMVEWQCEARAVLRKQLLEDLEIEVSAML